MSPCPHKAKGSDINFMKAQVVGLAVLCATILAGASVTFERTANQIAIKIAGQAFTTYYFDPETAKPYLMPLRTTSGLVITR